MVWVSDNIAAFKLIIYEHLNIATNHLFSYFKIFDLYMNASHILYIYNSSDFPLFLRMGANTVRTPVATPPAPPSPDPGALPAAKFGKFMLFAVAVCIICVFV